MDFVVFLICCCFATAKYVHSASDIERKYFNRALIKKKFSPIYSFLNSYFSKFCFVFLDISHLSEKLSCQDLETEINYPAARRDESVVDNLHGTKVTNSNGNLI